MASGNSGLLIGLLVALVAVAVIVVVPNPENERAVRLQNRIKHACASFIDQFLGRNSNTPAETFPNQSPEDDVTRVFTSEELKSYDGSEDSPGLYLAIMGRVFDVKKGEKHYASGGGYGFFAARDGSKAFITGDFTDEGLTPDVTGLSPQQMVDLDNWVKFYKKDYTYVGKLSGHYYDDNGDPTPNLLKAREVLEEGKKLKEDEAAIQRRYPPCNVEWKKATGKRFWCSEKSGGIQRDWTGVPRKLFNQGTNKWRCACIREEDLQHPHLRLYDGCDPQATSCQEKT